MLQRSDEWFESRLGRFTASDSDRLLGSLGNKTTIAKIETYAIEKASEMYFGKSDEDSFTSFHMENLRKRKNLILLRLKIVVSSSLAKMLEHLPMVYVQTIVILKLKHLH
jgi:broad-specificity NMP kinase